MISVVIIDDNKPLADRIAKTVPWEELGCEIVATEYNGQEGKKAILTYLPELIISDIRMPALGGLEMIELTRDHLPSSKIIFMSAYDDFNYAYKAIKLDAHDYLIKPFAQTELIASIRKAVDALNESKLSVGPITTPEPKTVAEKAIAYLEKHIGDRVTVADLAALFGISAGHMGRLIQQETGESFVDLYTRMRINKAKELLRFSDFRVSEISSMVGYGNYLSFYKVFTRVEGMPPTDYAKRFHNNPEQKDDGQ